MKLRNLILASGLTALAACAELKTSYGTVDIEDETYICRQTTKTLVNGDIELRINLMNKQGKELSRYDGPTKPMQLYGPTSPLTYWQTAELTEECIRKFSAAEKETK